MTVMDAQIEKDWNRLIADVVAGRWVNPETGRPADVPCRSIVLAETFDGAEADLLAAGHRRVWLQASLAGQPFYEANGYEAVDEDPWKSRGGLEIMVKRMEKTLA